MPSPKRTSKVTPIGKSAKPAVPKLTHAKGSKGVCYQLKIKLLHSPLPIWRRLLISSKIPLDLAHEIIQMVMGWTNSHLYQFRQGARVFGVMGDEGYSFNLESCRDFRLDDLLKKVGDKFIYEYDFGDSWEHEVVLEEILKREDGPLIAHCIGGKRACPPEDVGGPPGYADFLDAIEDEEHPEWVDKAQWIGCDFDADAFDARLVNYQIALLESAIAEMALERG